jgi:hypothetical protein
MQRKSASLHAMEHKTSGQFICYRSGQFYLLPTVGQQVAQHTGGTRLQHKQEKMSADIRVGSLRANFSYNNASLLDGGPPARTLAAGSAAATTTHHTRSLE